MPETESATRHDFFINDGAREAGLTQQFWYQAYLQFLKDTESDTTTPGIRDVRHRSHRPSSLRPETLRGTRAVSAGPEGVQDLSTYGVCGW